MINNHLNLNNLDVQHQNQHRVLFNFAQGVIEKTYTTLPTKDTLPVGYMGKYISGTTYRIYFNIDNILYYWSLTKV